MKKIIISTIFLFAVTFVSYSQTVFYVDGSVGTSGNGNSWASAFATVQEGIDAAHNSLGNPSTETAQVWVKQGTYYVYVSSDENTIEMKEGVQIFGGFDGTETELSQRNYTENETILDGHASEGSQNQVKHVVTAFGEETSPDVWNDWTNGLIDGFTITGGKIVMGAPGKNEAKVTSPEEILESANNSAGAGVLIFKSAPSVVNCKITGNEAPKGGGMYVMSATEVSQQDPVPVANIVNCEFSNNTAGMRGGAVSIDLYSNPVFENSKFINNVCDAKGGAVYIDWVCPQPIFINCLFAENYALQAAALGADGSSSPLFVNCTVTNNDALDIGAGLFTGSYNPDGTASNEPVLVNCIVTQNTSEWGGPTDLCIWHDNYFYVSHSILGEGFTSFGEGVSYETPTFANIGSSDYSLTQNSVGINAGVTTDDLLPDGIEVPTTDINGNPRDNNPDMGCYEYQGTINIPELETNQTTQFSIYPNPAKEFLTILPNNSDTESYKVLVYDNLGKMIFEKELFGEQKIEISQLNSGIYILQFIDRNKKFSHKLIVE